MPLSPTSNHSKGKSSRDFLVVVLGLATVLGVLFARSFQADQVHFSNDGPLGAANSQAGYAWKNVSGLWQDLNWLGGKGVGGFLSMGYILFGALGPLYFSKFAAPISLLILGLSAWFCFRRFGLSPSVSVLGGLAAALNMNAFSVSCWGLSGWTLSRASFYLALAAVAAGTGRRGWLRAILGGLALGLALMDGFDVGALYSLYVAAFVMFLMLTSRGTLMRKAALGAGRVAIVAIFAAMIAAQALTTLIGTQVKGIIGMQQDKETKEKRWTEATRSSLAKVETLRLVIPGLFGYRMPELYGEPPDSVNGSNYWGRMGQPDGVPQARHSGNGEFAGVLVALVALWGCVQSFRKKNNPFTEQERKAIWFWAGATVISLLLAFGRHAPFYHWVYALPYFSAIRNPFKFLHPLHVALVILFAYGLQGLWRAYLAGLPTSKQTVFEHTKQWWKTAPTHDRKWTLGLVAALVGSLVGGLIYVSSRNELVRHLQRAGFPDEQLAASIARFSFGEVGLFILFLFLSGALLTIILSGAMSGGRAKLAGIALGVLLIADLTRADVHWIVYYNYKFNYATNPIIDQLRDKPYEHRVTAELVPLTRSWPVTGQAQFFGALYYQEWLQHHFQYYRVQSLDIIQMPREPEFDKTYMLAFRPSELLNSGPLTLEKFMSPKGGRLWQLTNTRYVLAMTGFLDALNQRVDPGKGRFRIHTAFNVVPKPGITTATNYEQLTAVAETNGQFALFEFTGALPRSKLFNQWQVRTNDTETLNRLASPEFDPAQVVLVASDLPASNVAAASNQSPDTVEVIHYEPKVVRLSAEAATPAVLLLNDHYDPDWKVFVDNKQGTLLRCNYIARGVFLEPGRHTVEFRFEPSTTTLKISLMGFAIGILVCGFLAFSKEPASAPATKPDPAPRTAKPANRSRK